MTLNRAMFPWAIHRVLHGRGQSLAEVAVETRELCPEETTSCPPAVCCPGALDRVTALSPWRDWETEQVLLEGRSVTHAASRAVVLRDVVLAGGFLYCKGLRYPIGLGESQFNLLNLPSRQHYEVAHLAMTWSGAYYFGNFLQDNLPLEMLPDSDAPRLGAPGKQMRHAAGYRALLDLPPPDLPVHAAIKELTLYVDFAQNSLKAARYAELRRRMRASLQDSRPARPAPGIFLMRGTDGESRTLVNEAEVASMLAGLGFDIIDPAGMEPAEISARALDARVVVAVEGSHLAHAIYALADKGAFVVIQPPDRFALPYKEYADRMEMAFGFLVAHPAEGGFRADLEELKRVLELVA